MLIKEITTQNCQEMLGNTNEREAIALKYYLENHRKFYDTDQFSSLEFQQIKELARQHVINDDVLSIITTLADRPNGGFSFKQMGKVKAAIYPAQVDFGVYGPAGSGDSCGYIRCGITGIVGVEQINNIKMLAATK
jgi:hypothetical protein